VHDEFNYLLAADTFAHGRLTNPTPPCPEHFESMHILVRPTYQSKYPPGQGLALAAGIRLFGHPWAGVLISNALACAALFWALSVWLPLRYAIFGGLLASLHPDMLYWQQSYWGGGVAMIGGALVFGATGLLRDHRTWQYAAVLGLGAAILAASRPYEGLAVVAPSFLFLILGRSRGLHLAGAAIALVPATLLLGAYNRAVTGNAWNTPYALHDQTYCRTPHWFFLPLREQRPYANPEMAKFHDQLEPSVWAMNRSLHGWAVGCARAVLCLLPSLVLIVPLLSLKPSIWFSRRLGLPVAMLIGMGCARAVCTWPIAGHYVSPMAAAWMLLCITGIRESLKDRGIKWAIVALAVLAMLKMSRNQLAAIRIFAHIPSAWTVAKQLHAEPGKHLIIVSYAPGHTLHDEYVYNESDLHAAKVVWARDLGNNADLLRQFHDRKPWSLRVGAAVQLSSYSDQSGKHP
jgi:hypothetical protein